MKLGIVGALIAVALGWNAAEAHYAGCVEAAKAVPSGGWIVPGGPDDPPPPVIATRRERIDGCSRLPF